MASGRSLIETKDYLVPFESFFKRLGGYGSGVVVLLVSLSCVDVALVFLCVPSEFMLGEFASLFFFVLSLGILFYGLRLGRDEAVSAFNSVGMLMYVKKPEKKVSGKRRKKKVSWRWWKKVFARIDRSRCMRWAGLGSFVGGAVFGFLTLLGVFQVKVPVVSLGGEFLNFRSSGWLASFAENQLLTTIYGVFLAVRVGFYSTVMLVFVFSTLVNSISIWFDVSRVDEEKFEGVSVYGKFGFSDVYSYVSAGVAYWLFGMSVLGVALSVSSYAGQKPFLLVIVWSAVLLFTFLVPLLSSRGRILKAKREKMARLKQLYQKYGRRWEALMKNGGSPSEMSEVHDVMSLLDARREELREVSGWPVSVGKWKLVASVVVGVVSFVSTLAGLFPVLIGWVKAVFGLS